LRVVLNLKINKLIRVNLSNLLDGFCTASTSESRLIAMLLTLFVPSSMKKIGRILGGLNSSPFGIHAGIPVFYPSFYVYWCGSPT